MNRLEQVRRRRDDILRLASRYGICRVRLFGSVARGDAGAGSDVDVLVDFEPGRSLLDQAGFEQELASLLGCQVDVVAEGGLSPYLEANILRDAVSL
ncbi:MAG: nucleotidyltransferase family protein [Gemmataceae bacterium]|nr:nucleotidyltransferase family protein [Gemmataceae bacterium]